MRAVLPFPDIPGDNLVIARTPCAPFHDIRPRIMARSGILMGMNLDHAVWCFGFTEKSEAANAYGIHDPKTGFLWVLATRRTGKIKEEWRGFALNLPLHFRQVMDWELPKPVRRH